MWSGTPEFAESGQKSNRLDWKDYRAVLAPEEYDEAFLLSLLNDDSFAVEDPDGPTVWVPLHAWRALAQLRSWSVIELVLRLAESDDYQAYNDFEKISARIGEAAIGPLAAVLADRTHSDTSRMLAAGGLGVIGKSAMGESRRAVIDALPGINQASRSRGLGQQQGCCGAHGDACTLDSH